MNEDVAASIGAALVRSGHFSETPGFTYDIVPTLPHSLVARVRLASGKRLYFKQARPGLTVSTAVREVRFYREFAGELAATLVPAVLYAREAEDGSTLLLEDLEGRFSACRGVQPSFEQAAVFLEALADLHGSSAMTRPGPGLRWAAVMASPGDDTIRGRASRIGSVAAAFVEQEGSGLEEYIRTLVLRAEEFGSVVAREPALGIVHGDAHFWNAMYGEQRAVLIDWGNVALGPAGVDLAHAIALNLPREVGAEWEGTLLERYRERLARWGMASSADDVWQSYRTGILFGLLVPIGQRASGVPERVWRPLLRNVSAAARDLDVAALLE